MYGSCKCYFDFKAVKVRAVLITLYDFPTYYYKVRLWFPSTFAVNVISRQNLDRFLASSCFLRTTTLFPSHYCSLPPTNLTLQADKIYHLQKARYFLRNYKSISSFFYRSLISNFSHLNFSEFSVPFIAVVRSICQPVILQHSKKNRFFSSSLGHSNPGRQHRHYPAAQTQ